MKLSKFIEQTQALLEENGDMNIYLPRMQKVASVELNVMRDSEADTNTALIIGE